MVYEIQDYVKNLATELDFWINAIGGDEECSFHLVASHLGARAVRSTHRSLEFLDLIERSLESIKAISATEEVQKTFDTFLNFAQKAWQGVRGGWERFNTSPKRDHV